MAELGMIMAGLGFAYAVVRGFNLVKKIIGS